VRTVELNAGFLQPEARFSGIGELALDEPDVALEGLETQ
jgi:hypothetical protein